MDFSSIYTLLLRNQIQKDPGSIVGPLSWFFGQILNYIYIFVTNFAIPNSLGFSIVLLTIVVRTIMLPLAVKQQKSMTKMQLLTPEIEKIKKKYGKTKDPEQSQKMNREIQQLYTKHKVNPFGGCLPLFIQMPIFISINYIMNQPYLFINKIGEIYNGIATTIMSIPSYNVANNVFTNMVVAKVPRDLRPFDLGITTNIEKVINKITLTEWSSLSEYVESNVSSEAFTQFTSFLSDKNSIEFFFGIDLTQTSGFSFPGILIPVLSGLSMFLSSYFMMKRTPATNESAQMQQKIMLYGMPLFMIYITGTLTAGVGVYWITSNFYQLIQQYILNKKKDENTSISTA